MVETVFVQLGTTLVNVAKVQYFKPSSTMPHRCLMFIEGRPDYVELDISMENVQQALAETYRRMAMMQAAAQRGYDGEVH